MLDLRPIVAGVLGVFLLMLIGAGCRKIGWLTREADRSLANLTANVMLPAYFFARFVSSDTLDSLDKAWLMPAYGFAMTSLGFCVGLLIAFGLGRWIGLDTNDKQRAFALCVGICNYGFVPLPLAEQICPDAVPDIILHNVGVDASLWSIGILIIAGFTSQGLRRAVISPPLIAVALAIIVRQTGPHDWFPPAAGKAVLAAIQKLGNCAIPSGLLLSGAIIVDFLNTAKGRPHLRTVLAAISVRQGILPLLMLGIAMLIPTSMASENARVAMMLEAAMPAAVFPIVLTRLYERDTATALQVTLSTSLAGIVLIPAWIAIGSQWLGVSGNTLNLSG
ncbi:MAG: AEC family transporter [Planctomycetota bacterium]